MAKGNRSIRSNLLPKSGKSGVSKYNVSTRKDYTYDGIKFRSTLEINTYKRFIAEGFVYGKDFVYEAFSFNLIDSFTYPCMSYEKRTTKRTFEDRSTSKTRGIVYTPDFVGLKPDGSISWVMECKGFANDRFPNTWKMFKKHLMDAGTPVPLFVPSNLKEVAECIFHIRTIK